MAEVKNLPNLAKQIKRIIGKISRDSNKLQKLALQGKYDSRNDPNIFQTVNDTLNHRMIFITKSSQLNFIKLLKEFKQVFDSKKITYNTKQIEFKIYDFITNIIFKNINYDLNMIDQFIKEIEIPDYVTYFFRLTNFDYQQKINLGSNILIVKGKEILDNIPDNINRKSEKSPKVRTIIQAKDILLGITVIGSGRSNESYYSALEKATKVNNILNFLNGFSHKPSQVLELNKHIIQEDSIYQFVYKKNTNMEISNQIKNHWSTSTSINKDRRGNVNMNFDSRWLSNIPLIVEVSDKLSPLQKQCARAIDWIGDGIVNSNQTKKFLQIIISLETMIEQDPDELKSKLKKEKLWKDSLSVSIEDQIVSIMNLLCYKGIDKETLRKNDKAIKKSYNLRSRIMHDGLTINFDIISFIERWYDLSYTIISGIIFSGKWSNVYDLWKAANL